jgi:hypothetical protein
MHPSPKTCRLPAGRRERRPCPGQHVVALERVIGACGPPLGDRRQLGQSRGRRQPVGRRAQVVAGGRERVAQRPAGFIRLLGHGWWVHVADVVVDLGLRQPTRDRRLAGLYIRLDASPLALGRPGHVADLGNDSARRRHPAEPPRRWPEKLPPEVRHRRRFASPSHAQAGAGQPHTALTPAPKLSQCPSHVSWPTTRRTVPEDRTGHRLIARAGWLGDVSAAAGAQLAVF